ncbi:MAG: NADH-quinone oxidoreductase subunit C [Spirochaetes bacterium]|nr:MAG: NADH-quinone oxidoreductase subunit C [Spirochaetota bacterium]
MEYQAENAVIEDIKSIFKNAEYKIKSERRVEVKLSSDEIIDFAYKMQKDWDFPHLSAISCVDWIDDNEFELVYHFWSYNRKVIVSAKVRIPREDEPHYTSISHLWQPAKFFERDIHEMFGIVFDGNDDMEKFILTEWKGEPPMRKDFITREYALNHFHFKDYHPDWLKELENAGEQK